MQKIFYKVDTQNHVFLNDAYQPVAEDAFPTFLGDEFILCLDFVRYADGAWAADPQPAASTRALALKLPGEFFAATFLAYAGNAEWNVPGDRTDMNVAAGRESVRVALTDTALRDKFLDGGNEISGDYLVFAFEIELRDTSGKPSTICQQRTALYKDVNRGTEDATTTATPVKPTLAECQALFVAKNTDGGDFRVKDGKLQKINRTTGLFHDFGFETVDGVVVLWISQTGEA